MNAAARFLLLIASLFLACPLFAFRSRPVSDLVFDNLNPGGFVTAVSDGEDYLVVWQARWTRIHVQRVSRGGIRGPAMYIGSGWQPSAVWNGSSYLVAFETTSPCSGQSCTEIAIARVSRMGTLLGYVSQRIPASGATYARLAASGRDTLLLYPTPARTLVSVPLRLDGEPAGQPRETGGDGQSTYDVKPFRDHFVALLNTERADRLHEVRVVFLGADGSVKSQTTVEGPYVSSVSAYTPGFCVVATNGDVIAVAFAASKANAPTELKTAILDAQGVMTHAPTRLYIDRANAFSNGVAPWAMEWDGSAFVMAAHVSRGDDPIEHSNTDPALFRLSTANRALTGPRLLVTGAHRKRPTGLAVGNGEMLIAWSDETNQYTFGPACTTVQLGTVDTTRPVLTLGQSLDAQVAITVAAGKNEYLAAWVETDARRTTLRASRIDRNGHYLDGKGVIVGQSGRNPASLVSAFFEHPSIATDGTDWLVSGHTGTALLSTVHGQLTVKRRIAISGSNAQASWGRGRYLIVTAANNLIATVVERDGTIVSQRTIARADEYDGIPSSPFDSGAGFYTSPVITFDRRDFVVVVLFARPWVSFGLTGVYYDVVAMRVNADGVAVDHPIQIAKDNHLSGGGFPSIASNGRVTVIVYRNQGMILDPGTPPIPTLSFEMPESVFGKNSVIVTGDDALIVNSRGEVVIRARRTGLVVPVTSPAPDADRRVSSFAIAASATLPPMLGFLEVHEGQSRGGLLFLAEVAGGALAPVPPVAISATRVDDGTVMVAWRGAESVLGYSIEVGLTDGSWREIGVASGGATTAENVPLTGLVPVTVRLRAWNSGGVSAPSNEIWLMPRRRAVR